MRAFLIVALALLGSAPAFAECVTVKMVIDANPTATIAAHLDALNSGPFLASASTTTGVRLEEKEVLIMTKEGRPTYVVLFMNGCATKRGAFAPRLVDQWLHGLAG